MVLTEDEQKIKDFIQTDIWKKNLQKIGESLSKDLEDLHKLIEVLI